MAREYYSIPEAAALLGLSRIAVFKRVKAGRMAALRFGRNWAVPAEEVERFISPAAPPVPAAPARAEGLPAAPDTEMDSMGWD
jgi:excisionase family DNA binding protein